MLIGGARKCIKYVRCVYLEEKEQQRVRLNLIKPTLPLLLNVAFICINTCSYTPHFFYLTRPRAQIQDLQLMSQRQRSEGWALLKYTYIYTNASSLVLVALT